MASLLFVSSLLTVAHLHRGNLQLTRDSLPRSANGSYLFDFYTCPECNHGLNATAAMKCNDPEDPSVSSAFSIEMGGALKLFIKDHCRSKGQTYQAKTC